jgi:hypothetical protein
MPTPPRDNQGSREYDKQVKQAERGGTPAGEDAVANEVDDESPGKNAENPVRGFAPEKGEGDARMPDRGSSDTTSADKHKRGTAGE